MIDEDKNTKSAVEVLDNAKKTILEETSSPPTAPLKVVSFEEFERRKRELRLQEIIEWASKRINW